MACKHSGLRTTKLRSISLMALKRLSSQMAQLNVYLPLERKRVSSPTVPSKRWRRTVCKWLNTQTDKRITYTLMACVSVNTRTASSRRFKLMAATKLSWPRSRQASRISQWIRPTVTLRRQFEKRTTLTHKNRRSMQGWAIEMSALSVKPTASILFIRR